MKETPAAQLLGLAVDILVTTFFIYSNMSLFHYSFAYYFFFTEPRGLHSSSWTGCSITFKGYRGLLKLYPLLQS